MIKKKQRIRTVRTIIQTEKSEYTDLEEIISSLQFASNEVKDLPGFKKIADELKQNQRDLRISPLPLPCLVRLVRENHHLLMH